MQEGMLTRTKLKNVIDQGYRAFFKEKKPSCPVRYGGLMRKCWIIGFRLANIEYQQSDEYKEFRDNLPWNRLEKAA